ncbi:MAG: phage tail tape measure protein, partial [Dehalococcoidales bacterium]|nr:phage tail tape measure protein [Dehalococcoidales bacterium]
MDNQIGRLFITIGSDISGFTKGMNTVQGRLKTIGAGMTAAGAAGLKLVDSAREINAQLAATAITVGSTTKELRGMVMETANVTFGIDSVTKTFDLLARAGVKNREDMIASANAFDALADATNSNAEIVADILIPAYKVFGLELPKTTQDLDKFTWLVKNTTIDLEEFGSVMSYVAMYGADLGLTVEDLIAILAALEDRGIGGAEATRLFRTAVKQAADGVAPFNEILGVSQEQIAGYKKEMAEAIGITEQYADAAN